MGFMDDLRTRNFSIYGQWLGVLNIIICLALGIANIFHFHWIILFSVFCIISGLIIVFVEIPFLLRICPLTEKFVAFVKMFSNNLPRACFYLVLSVIQFLSCIIYLTSLLVPAITLLLTSLAYFLAWITKQEFLSSSTLGGANLARQIL